MNRRPLSYCTNSAFFYCIHLFKTTCCTALKSNTNIMMQLTFYNFNWFGQWKINNSSDLHVLGKVWCFIVDVNHSDPNRGSAGPRHLSFINCHSDKLIQVVQPLKIQRTSGENSPMKGDGKVWTKCVIRQISILPRVTVTGRHWKRDKRNKEDKISQKCVYLL